MLHNISLPIQTSLGICTKICVNFQRMFRNYITQTVTKNVNFSNVSTIVQMFG